MKIKLLSLVALLLLTMGSCKTMEETNNSWLLETAQGVMVANVIDSQQLSKLNATWSNKKEVKLKKMPQFDFILSIKKSAKIDRWLLSKSGYTMLKESKSKTIYKVSLMDLKKNGLF